VVVATNCFSKSSTLITFITLATSGNDKVNYKSGDNYLTSAKGRSNKAAVFLDSTGRSYALIANSLPSARGQGERFSKSSTLITFITLATSGNDKEALPAFFFDNKCD
jgi:DNA gyrase/topoisomerase IV subunit A